MTRPLLVLAVLVASLPALAAFTPAEAAREAARLHRPLPSALRTDQPVRLMFANGAARTIVYLNRHGGTYACGNNDDSSRNISSVVCGGNLQSGTVSAFSDGDPAWSDVMSCVQHQFSRFNITVTDQQPASGSYITAVVGGSPDQVGEPYGVGGVAPFACGVIDRAVVYAFSDVYGGDTEAVCETVAQEVSHAFGLDHEYLCQDPMTYLEGCGDKTFQDQDVACGEFQPRQCSCGTDSQNSVQAILQAVGASDGTVPPPPPADTAPPTVSLQSPDDRAILPANSTITVSAVASDDVSLPVVELQWDFTGESMFCPATQQQTGSYDCTQSGNTYTWSIPVGEGSRTFRVHVKDGAGHEAITESRTIWLSTDGSGPPQDAGPPVVFISSPLDGAQLAENSPVNVIAQAGDDTGLARVDLLWHGAQGGDLTIPCPSQDQGNGVSCVNNGSTYTWTLQVGTGNRTFSVRATDLVGNETTTPEVHVSFTGNPQTPPSDPNDNTIDTATVVHCGDSLDLHATDADWFAIDAPKDQKVTFSVDGSAKDKVSIVATRGAGELLEHGDHVVQLTGDGSTFHVGVLPDSANAGDYTMTVTCAAIRKPPAKLGGCASSGLPASWVALLAGLTLLRRKRG